MALELKGSAQQNIEASVDGLPDKEFPCKDQFHENSFERLPELKNVIEEQEQDQDAIKLVTPLSNKLSDNFNGYHTKAAYRHDSLPFYPESQKLLQQLQINPFERRSYPFHPGNGYQYVPFNGYAPDNHFQDFHYFVVIDFEATCDKEKIPHPQEIIEFPSVIVNSMTGQLEACFQTYVRPTCNQVLSDFCKDLTGIQQIQVDRGITLSEALLSHDKWLENKGIKNTNFVVVTWSNWDCRVMLESECQYKKIRKPSYFNRWINLRVPFHEVFGGARCNLKAAVEMAGLVWQGRAHCGLDDAKNTARLLGLLMHRGIRFSITNSMTWQETDQTNPAWNHSQLQVPHSALHPQYNPYCFCGVKSSKGLVRKPGLKQGSFFFGCGNWTAARGACCQFFEWTS